MSKDIVCNKCGTSCKRYWGDPKKEPKGSYDLYGLIEASFSTGYLSELLPDGMHYTFSLCETCLYDLFASFKIKPDALDYFLENEKNNIS